MDLKELGKILEERRKTLGIPRAELARRVDVSPSYVWTIEQAKPRGSGMPSQPSEELLERWAKVLGWEEPYIRQLIVLAGHVTQETKTSLRLPFMGSGEFHFPHPKAIEEEVLIQELRQLLKSAEDKENWEEAVELLRSFFGWLKFHFGEIDERQSKQ